MNYHHIYHAGNHADIVKHIILTICLDKFHEKQAGFFALDTHAGIGHYDLSDEKSLVTSEAIEGIRKLLQQPNFMDFLPARYLTILAKTNRCEIADLPEKIKTYTGSPAIIKDYLRRDDRAIFAELNPQDFALLKRNLVGHPKYSLARENGFSLLKSKLPPLEKRGLIIIDPAFEKDQKLISDDYDNVIKGLQEAHKRFAHGVYLIWYPIIKGNEAVLRKFHHDMFDLKFEKIMRVTFNVGTKEGETKMAASGMFILNAPWQLDEKLNVVLPQVLHSLRKGDDAEFTITYSK